MGLYYQMNDNPNSGMIYKSKSLDIDLEKRISIYNF
jgi:hypothetical protein